jgi:hypothetical protein
LRSASTPLRHSRSCLRNYRLRALIGLHRRKMALGDSHHLKGKITLRRIQRNDLRELENARHTLNRFNPGGDRGAMYAVPIVVTYASSL